ncbi:MAG: molybdopterin molybdotransferase MoeA, partial [Acidobacteriota bacterium]
MPDKLLEPESAWQRLADELPSASVPIATERMLRADALGRTLATDIAATVDQPVADVSAMDGYACAGDMPLGVALPVRGIAAAGPPPDFALAAGEIAKIMTGAVLPKGADRVLPIESTDGGVQHVVLDDAPIAGAHIRRRGEVVEVGSPLLYTGTRLEPAAISLIAAHGHREVEVVRRPTVAVLTTGDEVVPADQNPGPGQLRDSNSHFLIAACRRLGLDVEPLGIARDQRDDLRAKVSRGLEFDVLLLSGGVSKGDYDFVEDILEDHGCRRLIDAVAIQPGKPFVA